MTVIAFDRDAAQTYDKRVSTLVPGYAAHLEAAKALLSEKLAGNASILAAGSGTGNELIALLKDKPDWRITAADPSETMLDVAKIRMAEAGLQSQVEWHSDIVENMPSENKFDAAVCFLVTHFLPVAEKQALLSNIASRLSGQRILLCFEATDNHLDAAYWQWAAQQGRDHQAVSDMKHRVSKSFHTVNSQQRDEILRKAGFEKPQVYFQSLQFQGFHTQCLHTA